MMGNWRRRRQGCEYNNDQDFYRGRLYNRRNSQETWKLSVPLWEKKFCSSVSSFSWRTFEENKRYVHLYKNILEWDDSAGEEAFNDAKSRFWAKINNLPCNISLPDPDIHIDSIDWNASIDPELYLDLDKKPAPQEETQEETTHAFLCEALLMDPALTCTGWGDIEDTTPQFENYENEVVRGPSGWFEDNKPQFENHENRVVMGPSGWDDIGDSKPQFENHENEAVRVVTGQSGWGDIEDTKPRVENHTNDVVRGQFGWRNDYEGSSFATNNGWRNNDGSRHKNSRFPVSNDHRQQNERGYRGRWRKVTGANDKYPMRQWNMKSCAPVS